MNNDGWTSGARGRCNTDRVLADHQPVTPAIELESCTLSVNCNNADTLCRRASHSGTARRAVVDDKERFSGEDAGKGNLGGQCGIDPTSQDQTDKLKAAKKTETRHETDCSHSP